MPYDPQEGLKRADQWLRYEKLKQLEAALEHVIVDINNAQEIKRHCHQGSSHISCATADHGLERLKAIKAGALFAELLPEFIYDTDHHSSNLEDVKPLFLRLHFARETLQRVRNQLFYQKIPYLLTGIRADYTEVEIMRDEGLNLHALASLNLSQLEQLRRDITDWRITQMESTGHCFFGRCNRKS